MLNFLPIKCGQGLHVFYLMVFGCHLAPLSQICERVLCAAPKGRPLSLFDDVRFLGFFVTFANRPRKIARPPSLHFVQGIDVFQLGFVDIILNYFPFVY